MVNKNYVLCGIVVILSLGFLLSASSTNYTINSSVVGSGGDNISSDNYSIGLTVGEVSGNVSSTNYEMGLGFWSVSNGADLNITLDTTAPSVNITAPVNGSVLSSQSVSFVVETNENATCNLSLGGANYTMVANATNTGFTSTRTLANGAYTAGVFCWDSSNNLNGSKTVSFTVNYVAPTPTPSAGGGGGGGGVTTPVTPQLAQFEVTPETFEKTIALNRISEGKFSIENLDTFSENFTLEVVGLEEIISLYESYAIVAGGETKTLDFRIVAPDKVGVYPGKIKLTSSDGVLKEIFLMINVQTELSLYDLILTIPRFQKTIRVGENLEPQIDMIQMGIKEKMDVTLNYVIKDFEGNLYLTESETIMVNKQKTHLKELSTHDFPEGDFVLGVELIYPDGVAVASSQFKISAGFPQFFKYILFGVICVLIFILGYILVKYKKKKSVDKKRKKRR